jgi:hypothetical protein
MIAAGIIKEYSARTCPNQQHTIFGPYCDKDQQAGGRYDSYWISSSFVQYDNPHNLNM